MQSKNLLDSFKITPPASDFYVYDSEIFALTPKQYLSEISAYSIPIKTSSFLYHINLRYLYSQKHASTPTIIYLHGHGSTCTWTTWLKLAFLLYEQGYNGILIDLPGYGRSTIEGESRVNPKLYINDAANMFFKLFELLLANEKNKKIIGIGFCGGAANLIRTINEFPSCFAKRHIFHNSVIGRIPDNFEKQLEKFQIKVWVSWCEDPDHSHLCVGYKYFEKKRNEKNKHIFLQNIREEELSSNGIWGKNMGRKTSDIMIFDPSPGYFKFVCEFLNESNEKFPIYIKNIGGDKYEEILEKVIEMSLNDNKTEDDKELEKALALSLEQK